MEFKAGKNKIAVIGAGQMGYGIGLEFAIAGYDTWIYNRTVQASEQALQRSQQALHQFVAEKLLSAEEAKQSLARLHPTNDLVEATRNADYVAETIVESLPDKRELFAQLDRLCSPATILASNTSTFTMSAIVAENLMSFPERCCVAHYFQPAHLIPLVEVVGGELTSKDTLDLCLSLLSSIGKKPELIPFEIPGHIGNRIQGAMGREIYRLIKLNQCTPEMIDSIIMNGFGRRMATTGWFIRNDLIGLDKTYDWSKASGRAPADVIKNCVEQGELGMSTGKGVYTWPDFGEKLQSKQSRELLRYLKLDKEES